MRCIFCKHDSSTSVSVEHIVPESLGNIDHVLPVGVVCDGCNQYFARKVERQLLESPIFRLLRANMAIPNKRGRIPAWVPRMGQTDPTIDRWDGSWPKSVSKCLRSRHYPCLGGTMSL